MKQSALKSKSLLLVPSTDLVANEANSGNTADFFDGWLESITSPARNRSSAGRRAAYKANRPLTQADLNRVILSTVRESTDHRHWPPGVVEKFLVADVIPRKQR